MPNAIAMQELSIVVVAPGQGPSIVNLENLVFNGTIPKEWELAREPLYTPQMVQLVFQNGIAITSQSNRVVFSETISEKSPNEIQIPQLIQRYIQCFPGLDYEAIGINPMGHVDMGGSENAVHEYMNETLMSPGPWQSVGETPAQLQLNFRYTLAESQLNLTVSEVGLRNEDESVAKVLLFSGNFQYLIGGSSSSERMSQMLESLGRCSSDLFFFTETVNTKFLGTDRMPSPALLPIFAN
jgi:hypothetical protein